MQECGVIKHLVVLVSLSVLCGLLSGHNWNTLFVGSNAVADTMAVKYGKTKDEILSRV